MKLRIPWRMRNKESNFSTLEGLLAASLKTIKPRSEFVQNLRRQLTGEPTRKLFGLPAKSVQTGLLALGAGASILILLFAGIRVVISILSALGLIRQVKKQMEENQTLTRTTAA
jgi:hypothetical protein